MAASQAGETLKGVVCLDVSSFGVTFSLDDLSEKGGRLPCWKDMELKLAVMPSAFTSCLTKKGRFVAADVGG